MTIATDWAATRASRRGDGLDRTPLVALIKKANVQEARRDQGNFEISPADYPSAQRYVLCLPRPARVCEIYLYIHHMLVVFVVPFLEPEATARGSLSLLTDLISRSPRHQLLEVAQPNVAAAASVQVPSHRPDGILQSPVFKQIVERHAADHQLPAQELGHLRLQYDLEEQRDRSDKRLTQRRIDRSATERNK